MVVPGRPQPQAAVPGGAQLWGGFLERGMNVCFSFSYLGELSGKTATIIPLKTRIFHRLGGDEASPRLQRAVRDAPATGTLNWGENLGGFDAALCLELPVLTAVKHLPPPL